MRAAKNIWTIALIVVAPVLLLAGTPDREPWKTAWIRARQSSTQDVPNFRITFLSGTTPASITLSSLYPGPGTASLALYDAGDGNWVAYTSKTLTIVGSYIEFAGDWRTSGGVYDSMFDGTLNSTGYTCKFSGAFKAEPSTYAFVYRRMFQNAKAVVEIEHNPIPAVSGTPGANMFLRTYAGMSDVVNLPAGFLDTSKLTGAAANDMLSFAAYQMSKVVTLPAGFMDIRRLTGTLAPRMMSNACRDMGAVTALPEGLGDFSGFSGDPGTAALQAAFQGMSKVACGHVFNFSSNVTFTSANVVGPLTGTWRNMTLWTGEVMWGTNVLPLAFAPNSDINTFENSTNMPNYAIIDANWK